MSCCNGIGAGAHCQNCPAKNKPLVWPVLDEMPTPKHCETSKQPCATPWTCAPGCKLITTNSDGTSPDEKPLHQRESRMVWFVAGCMILCLVALALYQTF